MTTALSWCAWRSADSSEKSMKALAFATNKKPVLFTSKMVLRSFGGWRCWSFVSGLQSLAHNDASAVSRKSRTICWPIGVTLLHSAPCESTWRLDTDAAVHVESLRLLNWFHIRGHRGAAATEHVEGLKPRNGCLVWHSKVLVVAGRRLRSHVSSDAAVHFVSFRSGQRGGSSKLWRTLDKRAKKNRGGNT